MQKKYKTYMHTFNQSTLKNYMNSLRWEATGNLCMDACMTAIYYERVRRGLPLKAIRVNSYYWGEAMKWLEKKRNEKLMTEDDFQNIVLAQQFTLDGIEIGPSGLLTASTPMVFEYYTPNKELN
jgi:hypothetical protein